MACALTSGYTLGCRDNIGGVKRVFIGSVTGAMEEFGTVYTLEESVITVTTSDIAYYTFDQEMETASFVQNGAYSTENGTVFFDQQLSLVFHKNDNDARKRLLLLSQGLVKVIVEDQRGLFWLVGAKNGMRATSGVMNTGKAFGDMNGVTITLQGKEAEPAYLINADSVDKLDDLEGGVGFNIADNS